MAKLKKELVEENELLLERLNKLESLLLQQNQIKKETKKEEAEMISMHKIIKVVSLYNGTLNLKTSMGDKHSIVKFNFFGDEQPVFYADLVKAISIQRRFFQDGFCMILDDDVVKLHYLTDIYRKLLNKNDIDNFLDFTESEMKKKYDEISEQQKITILERIAYKINENNNVDKNKVDIVARISKQNLYELAEKLK